MKKFILLTILATFLSFGETKAQTQDGALEYMQDMFTTANDFKKETWQYLKAITRGKGPRQVEKKRQKLIAEMKNAKNTIRGKRSFKSDNGLKNALLEYLDLSYKVLKEDYDKILDMEAIAEQSFDLMEAYLMAQEQANDKLHTSFEGVVKAQKEFAEKNGITLVESSTDDETELKIEKANKALKYYNQVYLIFFKSYKQEIYFLDAQAKSDVTAMEQNMSSLESFSNEGIEILKTMESFDGDAELKMAARKMIDFYNVEVSKDFPGIVDFFLVKDKFEKIQKQFEAKSKKTQEDVDKYNNALEDYNNGINSYNKIIESTNKKRSASLDAWNTKVSAFFDKHSK